MKRVFKVLLVLLVAMVPFVAVSAKSKTTTTAAKGEPINFYEFYGSTCSHCAELNEWLENTLAKDSDYNYKYKFGIKKRFSRHFNDNPGPGAYHIPCSIVDVMNYSRDKGHFDDKYKFI